MSEKSKYQLELEQFPEWAWPMVRALSRLSSYGFSFGESALDERPAMTLTFDSDESEKAFTDGFYRMRDLAKALTAPYPPPTMPPRPPNGGNLVELLEDEEECKFDQPCYFGHRVGGHAVYCTNEAWPNSPRKCRRTWYTGGETRDEDCPGYVPNPEYKAP